MDNRHQRILFYKNYSCLSHSNSMMKVSYFISKFSYCLHSVWNVTVGNFIHVAAASVTKRKNTAVTGVIRPVPNSWEKLQFCRGTLARLMSIIYPRFQLTWLSAEGRFRHCYPPRDCLTSEIINMGGVTFSVLATVVVVWSNVLWMRKAGGWTWRCRAKWLAAMSLGKNYGYRK